MVFYSLCTALLFGTQSRSSLEPAKWNEADIFHSFFSRSIHINEFSPMQHIHHFASTWKRSIHPASYIAWKMHSMAHSERRECICLFMCMCRCDGAMWTERYMSERCFPHGHGGEMTGALHLCECVCMCESECVCRRRSAMVNGKTWTRTNGRNFQGQGHPHLRKLLVPNMAAVCRLSTGVVSYAEWRQELSKIRRCSDGGSAKLWFTHLRTRGIFESIESLPHSVISLTSARFKNQH